jgi:8-oxo-dGTP diphosphatase
MAVDPEAAEVKASGGVVWRPGEGGVEIVIVHRPQYDDWSLPKGKLDKGETWEEAALREVEEEVGLKCRLLEELEPTSYEDRKGRAKVVRYWLMEPKRDREFKPNDEVDEIRWLSPEEAAEALSYPHDAQLVREAARRIE